jgi:hypothetical protein
VDFAAMAVRLLTTKSNALNPIAYVQTPHKLTQAKLVEVLNSMGNNITLLDSCEYRQMLLRMSNTPNSVASLGRLLPLVEIGERAPREWDVEGRGATLSNSDFTYPQPTSDWLEKFVVFGRNLGYFPPPGSVRHL